MSSSNKKTIMGVVIDETVTFSFTEICQRYHISKDLLMQMMEQGLFEAQHISGENIELDPHAIRRIESALRLQHDLDINLPGVILALELIDEIEKIRKELHLLQKFFE